MEPMRLDDKVTPADTRVVTYKGPPGDDVGDLQVLAVDGLAFDQRTRQLIPVTRMVASCWELNDEERLAIAEGAAIWLELQGSMVPPLNLRVGRPLATREEVEAQHERRADLEVADVLINRLAGIDPDEHIGTSTTVEPQHVIDESDGTLGD